MDETEREKIDQVRSLLGVKSERIVPASERVFVEGPTIADMATPSPTVGRPRKQLAVTREELQTAPPFDVSSVLQSPAVSPPAQNTAPTAQPASSSSKRKEEQGDLPLDAIRDLTRNYEEVVIRLTRRGDRGVNAVIYNGVKIKTKDLLRIDAFAAEVGGGGGYKVEVRDPFDLSRDLLPPFTFVVDGPPKPPRAFDDVKRKFEEEGAVTANQNGTPPGPWGPWGPWPGPWSPGPQPGVPFSAAVGLSRPGFHIPKLRRRVSDDASIASLRAEVDRLKDALRDREREVERERFQAQLQALTARLEAQAQPKIDWAALVGAVAPILTTVVSSRSNESQKLLEAQVQLAGMAQQGKTDPVALFKDLSTTLQPLLTTLLERSSPAAQTQLMQALTENNLSSVAMMAQLLETLAKSVADKDDEDEEPWWMPYIRTALENVVKLAQANATTAFGTRQLVSPGQPAPMLGPPPAGQLGVTVSSGADDEDGDEGDDDAEEAPRSAAGFSGVPTNAIPEEFRTREWLMIFDALRRRANPTELAELIHAHMVHLAVFGILPDVLLPAFQGHARVTVEQFLRFIPVCAEDPSYCNAIVEHLAPRLEATAKQIASEPPKRNKKREKKDRVADVIPIRNGVSSAHAGEQAEPTDQQQEGFGPDEA